MNKTTLYFYLLTCEIREEIFGLLVFVKTRLTNEKLKIRKNILNLLK